MECLTLRSDYCCTAYHRNVTVPRYISHCKQIFRSESNLIFRGSLLSSSLSFLQTRSKMSHLDVPNFPRIPETNGPTWCWFLFVCFYDVRCQSGPASPISWVSESCFEKYDRNLWKRIPPMYENGNVKRGIYFVYPCPKWQGHHQLSLLSDRGYFTSKTRRPL